MVNIYSNGTLVRIIILFLLFICFNTSATSNSIAISAGNLEYQIAGSGQHTILLEAGGTAGLNDWDPVFSKMAKHAKVIRYSRIGNGKSSKIRKNYSSEQYADEAMELLTKLNIKQKVIYVAHSYGGYIARVFAARFPNNVAALYLIEPASEHDVDIMRSINLVQAEKEIAQVKMDDMKNGMSNQYLDFWSKRPLPDYPQIPDIPVTVIASVKKYPSPSLLFFTDEGRKKWGQLHQNWAKAFPQGKAVLTEKSYHYPQQDEPDLIIKELLSLLAKI